MAIVMKNIKPIFGGRVRVSSTVFAPTWATNALLNTVDEDSIVSVPIAVQFSGPVSVTVLNMPEGFGYNASTKSVTGIAPSTNGENITITFTLRATALVNGLFVDRTFTLPVRTVNPLPVWQTPGDLGVFYGTDATFSQQLVAEDNTGVARYELVSGTLPPTFTLTPQGLLSGTANTSSPVAEYKFTVNAVDTKGASKAQEFSLFIYPNLDAMFSKPYTARVAVLSYAPVTQLAMDNEATDVPVNYGKTALQGTSIAYSLPTTWPTENEAAVAPTSYNKTVLFTSASVTAIPATWPVEDEAAVAPTSYSRIVAQGTHSTIAIPATWPVEDEAAVAPTSYNANTVSKTNTTTAVPTNGLEVT